jgi:hypothetical protein
MYYVGKTDGLRAPETEESSLAEALLYAVCESAKDGNDRVVHRQDDGGLHSMYLVEADTKVDEEDARFPVIVHTEAILVGENA